MSLLRIFAALIVASGLAFGCSSEKRGGGLSGAPVPIKPVDEDDQVPELSKDYRYDPSGKPDPFRSYIRQLVDVEEELTSPLQRFDLSQLLVTGILWNSDDPRALIQDPSGKGYIVQTDAAIGKNRGRIVGIEDNRIIIKETYVDFQDQATTKEVDLYLYERGEE